MPQSDKNLYESLFYKPKFVEYSAGQDVWVSAHF